MRISDWSSDVCSSDLRVLAILTALAALSTFSRAAWRYVTHPSEFVALLKFKYMHAVPGVPTGITANQLYAYQKLGQVSRSEERRVGKECVSKCRARWSPLHIKYKHNQQSTRQQ